MILSKDDKNALGAQQMDLGRGRGLSALVRRVRAFVLIASAAVVMAGASVTGVWAGETGDPSKDFDPHGVPWEEEPMNFEQLANIGEGQKTDGKLPLDIRADALRDAALSYGARGGLAWQSWNINRRLARHAESLSQSFNFRALLIPAPSGLLIEPPVITEDENALLVETDGQAAATTERLLRINEQVKLVTTARDWRMYLWREWGDVEPPPDLLIPRDDKERALWQKWLTEGWKQGVHQADEIFQISLNRLTAEFTGMVRYRHLLAEGIVSPPYAVMSERGITGGGDELRVGDRLVRITGQPELNPRGKTWVPADR